MVSNSKSDIQSNVIIVCFGMNLVFTDVCNLVAVINSSYFNKRFALRLISNEILTPQFESCEVHVLWRKCKRRSYLFETFITQCKYLTPVRRVRANMASLFCSLFILCKGQERLAHHHLWAPMLWLSGPSYYISASSGILAPKISESLRSVVCALYRVIPHSIKVNETNRTGFLIA